MTGAPGRPAADPVGQARAGGPALYIGLTGGIATGKSTVAARLAEHGAILVDADVLAREVVAPGSEGLQAVVEAFGPQAVREDGEMDRAAVGQMVFRDPELRARLNAIIHPRVREAGTRIVESAGPDAVVVHDIPLLVETGQQDGFDHVLVIEAPEGERIRRMVEDRAMTEDDARARMAAQATDAQRRAAADTVIVNDGDLEQLHRATDRFWEEIVRPAVDRARE